MRITPDLVRDFIDCRYKAFQKVSGCKGERTCADELEAVLSARHRDTVTNHLQRTLSCNEAAIRPIELTGLTRSNAEILLDVTAFNSLYEWTFHAIRRSQIAASKVWTVRFSRMESVSRKE